MTTPTPEIPAKQARRRGRLRAPVVKAATVHSRRIDGVQTLEASRGTTLVAIGNFDGVHAGHRAVLGTARARARSDGLSLVVLTFDPHPAEVLADLAESVDEFPEPGFVGVVAALEAEAGNGFPACPCPPELRQFAGW